MTGKLFTILMAATVLAGCGKPNANAAAPANEASRTAEASNSATWPASLRVVGDGFPNKGDPCRIIGESEKTVDLLDDSATLAGCQIASDAKALGGRVVGTVEGITLVSVPRGTPAARAGDGDGSGDSKVAGTSYNATAEVPCSGITGGGPTCKAGVTRKPDQIAIDLTLPGGKTRTLLFNGKGQFVTHASAQADGSAALQSGARRDGDWQVVTVGSEVYRIPDPFVLGD